MSNVEQLEKLTALHIEGVLTTDEYVKARKRLVKELTSPAKSPAWMKPWGQYLVIFCGIALGIIAWTRSENSNITDEALLVELLLNPLFFVGMPLGLYWMNRGDEHHREKN